MNKNMIKELLKAHCTIENGRWVFKQVDIDAASLELEQAISAKPFVSGSLLSFEEIMNEAKRVKENIKVFPFHEVSFQYGAEWSRDTLIEEIKRRQQLIISEPGGIVRETMIDNLLVGAVMRSCVHCGNKKDFEVWTELEYDDGSDEPTTGNHLINVEYVKCLNCGEVL